MKLTDGKKTVEIKMMVWEDGSGYTPDWSHDFFNAGSLDFDEERDAYVVKDVDYCIEMAHDWEHSIGDFCDDIPNENNTVFVNVLETNSEKGEAKQYRVKQEYLDKWVDHSESANELTVTEDEVKRLASEWGMSVDDLIEQLDEVNA